MAKMSGIRSVDFRLKATGEGVVNHNGSFSVFNPAAEKVVKNHMFPKLRGIDPLRKYQPDQPGAGGSKILSLSDPDLEKATLVVSANCVRHYLFKDVSFGTSEVTRANIDSVLPSLLGLVRGYLITAGNSSFPRKSALYITDFECKAPGLRFNQCSKAGSRTDTSIFSNFATDGDLRYEAKGSLSVEDLQFIPLENSLGRSAYDDVISEAKGVELAESVTRYLHDLSGNNAAEAKFLRNAVRVGALYRQGEAGLLLNDAALDVVVGEMLELLGNLYIRQSKGFLKVTRIEVDYNDQRAPRIFTDPTGVCSVRTEGMPYARYYEDLPISADDFRAKMENRVAEARKADAKKEARKPRAKGGASPAGAGTTPDEAEHAAVGS